MARFEKGEGSEPDLREARLLRQREVSFWPETLVSSRMVAGNEPVTDAVAAYCEYVATETLVSRWDVPPTATPFLSERHTLGEATWTIRLVRENSPTIPDRAPAPL